MFEKLLRSSLKNRLIVLGLAGFLLIYGGLTVRQMPVDVFPDLNKPTVTLITEAGGMAPEEVEQLVTFPIESSMTGMPGVGRVRSVSGVGLSIVYIEFAWGSNVQSNRQQITERLNLVREQLPAGVTPQLAPITSIMGEILLVAFPANPEKISPMAVREYVDWVVRPRLLTIPGIAQVIPIGGEVRQYRVELRAAQLQALGIEQAGIEAALRDYGNNTSGGFLEANGREYLIRLIGRNASLDDLSNVVVGVKDGQAILLKQLADVKLAPAVKRGDGSFNGKPAVILSVQKQPLADSIKLTKEVEKAISELGRSLPKGMEKPSFLFKQADFIEHSINNVAEALRDAGLLVALILFMFLLNVRTTLISLMAIPVSLLATALIFHFVGLSINTMTLGGLAIAIGELVDDAVVGVENVLRRLKQNRSASNPKPTISVIADATLEVRSAIVYATAIIVLVFMPLFVLPGIEGRLFTPMGIAYIVSILASMLVSVTLTPVMAYYLLANMPQLQKGDSAFVGWLKRGDECLLVWSFAHAKKILIAALLLVVLVAASVPFFPRTFLPSFNEGTLTVSLLLNPGASLTESNRLGTLAEQLVAQVPEVTKVGRRTGRAELDEHAEGVHSAEMDIDLKPSQRGREEIIHDIRQRLNTLPVVTNIGQPISHRLDHLLSGVRAQIALKITGDELSTLRNLTGNLHERLAKIPNITDLQIEKQVLIPQIKVHLDYAKAAQYGIAPGRLLRSLEQLIEGQKISQINDANRRFDLVLRLPDHARNAQALANLIIETPTGSIPLSSIAEIKESEGPNQINRENSRRRIVISANADGRHMSQVITDMRAILANEALPNGYFTSLEGQFQAQEQSTQLITGLALISISLIFMVLYSRYRSTRLSLMIMANIPLALIGSVIALWISGQTLSLAALVGFITLTGVATRNGILKISHYINLCAFEGERFGQQLIIRGSLERLTPVLMTAMIAAFGLLPLLISADAPGKEILHPIAVVIFGGLISSTLLDTLLTPLMFWLWGEKPLTHLLETKLSGNLATESY
jgi:heavy-metal exporter, HME family